MLKSIFKEVLSEILQTFKKPLLLTVVLFAIVILTSPILIYLYFAKDLASKESIINSNNRGVILLDRNGQPFFNFYEAKTKIAVPLSEIPDHMQEAVISVEDKDFYEHGGFSIRAILRAMFDNLRSDEATYGASTITQQLVKNALLTPQKSLSRKYQEIILAFEIERLYTKEEILEMYLNSVYFGEGATGVGTASLAYFSKDVSELTLAESALLAGILPAPSMYSPISGDRETAFELQKRVLEKMEEQGYITNLEKEQAEKENINLASRAENINMKAPHFALMVKDELLKEYSEEELETSGFKVKTTIDLDFQEFAETTVNQQVERLRFNKVSNGAAVVLDPKTSEILALVGSKNWFNEEFGKFNVATALRQAGSAFKPIIYAKALEDRIITPSTVLKDEPKTFERNYKPKNYDGKFRGNLLPRRALANSINVPAIEVMEKVGVFSALDFAKEMGMTTFTDPSNYGLSLVLGAGEVKLLELTNAFAVFANNGKLNTPTTILEIKNKIDRVIYTHEPTQKQVLNSGVAYIISSFLSDNRARAEVFGNALTINRPAAVKTGTTEDYRDALTIGYTPSVVVGVWVGNNDNTPMDRVAGSLGAAPIWRLLMTQFLSNTPSENFEKPSNLIEVYICNNNGLRAKASTSSAHLEYYLAGTQPQRFCDFSSTRDIKTPTPTTNNPSPSPTTANTPTPQPTAVEENKDNEKKNDKNNGNDKDEDEDDSASIIPLPLSI